LEPAQNHPHGRGQTTQVPLLRGLLDPSAASRWQGTTRLPLSRLRPSRPVQVTGSYRLVKERATAAEVRAPQSAKQHFWYLGTGTIPHLPRDLFGLDNRVESGNARQTNQAPTRDHHGRCLSRRNRYRLIHPSHDGVSHRLYVKGGLSSAVAWGKPSWSAGTISHVRRRRFSSSPIQL